MTDWQSLSTMMEGRLMGVLDGKVASLKTITDLL